MACEREPEVEAFLFVERASPALLGGAEGVDERSRRFGEELRELRERRAEFVFVEAVEAQLDDVRDFGGARARRAQLRRATRADGDADANSSGFHQGVCHRNSSRDLSGVVARAFGGNVE